MMEKEGESEEGTFGGHCTWLPVLLNFKRLMTVHLRRLAMALNVPMMVAGVVLEATAHNIFHLKDTDRVL